MIPEIILQKNGIEFTESGMCYCTQEDVVKSMKEYAEQESEPFKDGYVERNDARNESVKTIDLLQNENERLTSNYFTVVTALNEIDLGTPDPIKVAHEALQNIQL